jgi:beta-lactamase class A
MNSLPRLMLPALLVAFCGAVPLAVIAAHKPQEKKNGPWQEAREEIEKRIAASGAELSLAFRTLDGKLELLLRPDETYHAASTMKLAVMVELFHQLKQHKLKMDDALPVRNEFSSLVDGSPFQLDAGDDDDPEVYKKIGGTMTLGELCEHMITRSSNLATDLLMDRLGVENIRHSVTDAGATGLDVKRAVQDIKAYEKGINNTTTARALLILLERIAHLKAVDRESSLKMLAILKRQTFREAIPAGVPSGIVVAHKTGEITRIHHDAAVVYAPRPFVLVLLVRGIEDRDKSSALMSGLTSVLYQVAEPPATEH